MEQASMIGLDIAKHVFQVHGADAVGHVLFRKRVTRAKLIGFLAAQTPCVVAMEACAGGHYWAREISKLGHRVQLIAPAYVKPFVKRQKNDAADAEAICEAAQRPSMRFVPVKTEEQQANGIVFRARDLLVRQRTQCVNALRGHLFEYGYVFPQGITHVATLVALVEDPQSCLPESVRVILKLLEDTFTALDGQIAALDAEINRRSKADPTARRLMTIPGVGPIASTAIAKARRRLETRRTYNPALADHWGECRGSTGQPARGTQGIVACPDVGSQTEDAGHRGSGHQDGPHRLGSAGQRRHLQSSGRGGVGWLRSRRRRGERNESMAQQSARRGWDNQGFPQCFEHAWVIWTWSANSHTGRRLSFCRIQRPDR